MSAFPYGFHGLENLIWYDEEVAQTLRDRWSEALTLSGLLVAGQMVGCCSYFY